jgi:hypothetical protein
MVSDFYGLQQSHSEKKPLHFYTNFLPPTEEDINDIFDLERL